jgi:hypothetical protein
MRENEGENERENERENEGEKNNRGKKGCGRVNETLITCFSNSYQEKTLLEVFVWSLLQALTNTCVYFTKG